MTQLARTEPHGACPLEEIERVVDYVCEHLEIGRSVMKIFAEDGEEEGLCNYSTFNRWQREHSWIQERISSAREIGQTALVEQMVDIADNDKDPKRARVRIYAREKQAQMLSPKRFGAKVDITSDGEKIEGPVINNDNRMQALILKALARKEAGISNYDLGKQLMED